MAAVTVTQGEDTLAARYAAVVSELLSTRGTLQQVTEQRDQCMLSCIACLFVRLTSVR